MTAVQKPHGNHKPKIYNRYTHTKKKKESKRSIKYSHQIIREENQRRGKNKKTYKSKSTAMNKMVIEYTHQ